MPPLMPRMNYSAPIQSSNIFAEMERFKNPIEERWLNLKRQGPFKLKSTDVNNVDIGIVSN